MSLRFAAASVLIFAAAGCSSSNGPDVDPSPATATSVDALASNWALESGDGGPEQFSVRTDGSLRVPGCAAAVAEVMPTGDRLFAVEMADNPCPMGGSLELLERATELHVDANLRGLAFVDADGEAVARYEVTGLD